MSNLTYLNDASVLHNLKQRYYAQLIYVRQRWRDARPLPSLLREALSSFVWSRVFFLPFASRTISQILFQFCRMTMLRRISSSLKTPERVMRRSFGDPSGFYFIVHSSSAIRSSPGCEILQEHRRKARWRAATFPGFFISIIFRWFFFCKDCNPSFIRYLCHWKMHDIFFLSLFIYLLSK